MLLALVATCVSSFLFLKYDAFLSFLSKDSFGSWQLFIRKVVFNADMYKDVYHGHKEFLQQIKVASLAKYHFLMADLYIHHHKLFFIAIYPAQLLFAELLQLADVNNAMALLDLDNMAED